MMIVKVAKIHFAAVHSSTLLSFRHWYPFCFQPRLKNSPLNLGELTGFVYSLSDHLTACVCLYF